MRNYRWYENVISGAIAVAIAIPVCVCAYRSQQIPKPMVDTGVMIELDEVETAVVPEEDVIEPVKTLSVIEPITPLEPVVEVET